jgi:protoporphyrinogen oxidase
MHVLLCRGYMTIMDNIDSRLQKLPGLYLGGNYRCGVSIGDCIEYGHEIANQIEKYITSLTH